MLLKRSPISGFTLIELIIVIIILAVLSVIAVPKLLDLSSDAKAAKVRSLAALISSQNQLTFAKSNLANIETLEGCTFQCGNHPNWDARVGEYFIDASGTRLYVSFGYPIAPLSSSTQVNDNYRQVFGLNEQEFYITVARTEQSATAIVPVASADKLTEIANGTYKCHVVYGAPTQTRDYFVRAYSDDC
ncbi:prepilin-type N-terminal cleavage/methylation domain-containing protein [Shewanella sp. KX20019]|uniref:prepilin-type N-terminal cleavage/methylation domain-containing protein n=1 Tax=Shewanella sp. KX20019 TaxID=2803864 RepID=UPI001927FC27|nr:prepilin-type N-terminal cleavage/methylation domain-containing protein [Shewanella sp. KX20019]QQX82330.1 prepilin-type N-terminal cleavage/methylation domain-containing protein [Shewanella sp. KX20019]